MTSSATARHRSAPAIGISYERNFGNITFNLIQNPPNYAVVVDSGCQYGTVSCNNASVPPPAIVTNSNLGPLAGASVSVPLPPASLRHVDQNIRTAQTQFWSASIDQQLAPNTVVEISYNGSRGVHLYDIKNYNIPGSGNLYLGDPIKDPISGKSALPHSTLNSRTTTTADRAAIPITTG